MFCMSNENTDAQSADILVELSQREPIFHRPEFGTSRADVERLMASDYWEVGASGQIYDRAFVFDELQRRSVTPREEVWETSDFRCRRLGSDVYLLTYYLIQNRERHTRRSTIWWRTSEGWKIIYHQGTLVQSP